MRQPKFLFIITPPYSGSTVLAEILNTSPRSMLLNPRGEGQWLIPSLCADDRWDPAKIVDWNLVRNTWLNLYQNVNMLVGTIDVIIEKSPANLVRIAQLRDVFPGSSCFAFNRNPYAHCSSFFRRHHSPEALNQQERAVILEDIAGKWIMASRHIRNAVDEMGLLNITYEQFCENPADAADRILEVCPDLVAIDSSSPVKVKDYPAQPISNQNQRQINLLSDHDFACISRVLEPQADLLAYFNYSIT